MTFVPPIDSVAVKKLCSEVNPDALPLYVPVQLQPSSRQNFCNENVAMMIEEHGGHMQCGWEFWQWDNKLVEAEAHAIWAAPTGEWIDVSPHGDGETQILFLPDDSVILDGTIVPSHRRPLSASPLVSELIPLLHQHDLIKRSLSMGTSIDDSVPVVSILQRMTAIRQSMSKKVGRNDPCPCCSGLKYKRCCGPYR